MLFDFLDYLGRIDPLQKYSVQTLTGGIINVTIRATKTGTLAEGFFPKRQTLVMKYCPPFVAGRGKSVPITAYRQVSS